MYPRVFREFDRICSARGVGGSVLEVGAIPSDMSLLCLKSLGNATEKVGINLDGPYEYMDFKILKGNANSMEFFEDNRFDVVLCNAVLEHDKYFWRTVGEIKRVARLGGLVVIGTPGYTYLKVEKVKSVIKKIPGVHHLRSIDFLNMFLSGTITTHIHNAPGDYYRFSPQTFEELFFEGMVDVEVRSLMLPPIIIGVGRKSKSQ